MCDEMYYACLGGGVYITSFFMNKPPLEVLQQIAWIESEIEEHRKLWLKHGMVPRDLTPSTSLAMIQVMVAGASAWLALEALLYLCWRYALGVRSQEHRLVQRLTAYSVRWCHAMGIVFQVARIFVSYGTGLDGALDRTPCEPMSPSVDTALYFSLSWTFWEATSVLRDLEGDGAISLVHVLIMGSAIFAAIHAGVCRGRAVPRWGGEGGRGGKKLVRVFSCHGGFVPHRVREAHDALDALV